LIASKIQEKKSMTIYLDDINEDNKEEKKEWRERFKKTIIIPE
jgi:hypothetical protein